MADISARSAGDQFFDRFGQVVIDAQDFGRRLFGKRAAHHRLALINYLISGLGLETVAAGQWLDDQLGLDNAFYMGVGGFGAFGETLNNPAGLMINIAGTAV